MRISILTSLLSVFNCCFAQVPSIQWQKCLGGSSIEAAYSVQETYDGGFILVGQAASNDGDVTGNHGQGDFWVVKLNALGDIDWQKSLGGSNFESAEAVQQTIDSGYIITGYTKSNDGDVTGNHGNADVWVVKLGSSGVLEWQKCLGGSNDDYAKSIEQTTDGGYVLAGYTDSDDGDVVGKHIFENDMWVVKLFSDGNIDWQRCLGGDNVDEAFAIQQTTDGNYIIAGFASGAATGGSNNGDVTGLHGARDMWIVKLNSLGNTIIWQKCFGGTNAETANSIEQVADGGYIIAGQTSSNDGDVSGNNGYWDFWVIKIDFAGGLEWQKCFGGSNLDYAYSVRETLDSNYIVTGLVGSNDGSVIGSHGGWDMGVLKLSHVDGGILWQKCLGGSSLDFGTSIREVRDGGYVVVGDATSNNGDVTGLHGFLDDAWIVKLNSDILLPLKLIAFNVFSDNGIVKVTWKTEQETNTESFDIERSNDGRNFSVLSSVKANEGAGITRYYQMIDRDPLFGKSFYRLKQRDLDGLYTYSNIRTVFLSSINIVSVTPNPVKDYITLKLYSQKKANIELLFSTADGRIVHTQKVSIEEGSSTKRIQLFINKGLYFLSIRNNNQNKVLAFIKE